MPTRSWSSAGSEAELAAETLDGTDERKPSSDCALGVVVARPIGSEDGHRRVTDELLELASVAGHGLSDGREVGVLNGGHVLRHPAARRAA